MLNLLGFGNNTRRAVDADASVLDYWQVTGAVYAVIGATCSMASGTLTYRLIYADEEGTLTGCSPPTTLTSAAGLSDYGAVWIGTPAPGQDPCVFICADRMTLKVDAIVGVWTLAAQTYWGGKRR